VALLYLNHIIPYYSIPYKIISDQDVHFISKFSTELCHILNIHQNISMAYHPQTNGASERTNQTNNISKFSAEHNRTVKALTGLNSMTCTKIELVASN